MSDEFQGRRVVVTGGTGALGSAVVGALLERGAECHIPCFDADELSAFEHRDAERVHVTEGVDLTQERAAEGYFDGLPPIWASLNIAGGFAMASIEKTGLERFRTMIDVNATTCYAACREAVKKMRAAGAGGRIVNVSAKPALIPAAGLSAYSASKAAVAAITQSLAEEVKDDGIWVNAVAPSIMDTPDNRDAMPQADHDKWPKVHEVAETVLFLASPANKTTRGAVVPVYGRT